MSFNDILCTIAVCYSFIALPLNYYLNKWQQEKSFSSFYRLMHSTNFDLAYDIMKKISESDDNTKQLFSKLRLYLYDKFSQQLSNIIKILEETESKDEIILKINNIKKEYENKDKPT